jgi:hypothetical protein
MSNIYEQLLYEPKIFLRKGENWFQSLPNARGHCDRRAKSVQKSKSRSPIRLNLIL